jgi:hypothetical protein
MIIKIKFIENNNSISNIIRKKFDIPYNININFKLLIKTLIISILIIFDFN